MNFLNEKSTKFKIFVLIILITLSMMGLKELLFIIFTIANFNTEIIVYFQYIYLLFLLFNIKELTFKYNKKIFDIYWFLKLKQKYGFFSKISQQTSRKNELFYAITNYRNNMEMNIEELSFDKEDTKQNFIAYIFFDKILVNTFLQEYVFDGHADFDKGMSYEFDIRNKIIKMNIQELFKNKLLLKELNKVNITVLETKQSIILSMDNLEEEKEEVNNE